MLANEQTIQEIARRLVDSYRSVRVYPFGSVARGDGGSDSDLDFCVAVDDETLGEVFRGGASRRALVGASEGPTLSRGVARSLNGARRRFGP